MLANPSLVILAAGLGKRFGGNKQTASVGPQGQWIMDYSIHDAITAGCKKVIIVVNSEVKEAVIQHFNNLFPGVDFKIVLQENNLLNQNFFAEDFSTTQAEIIGRRVKPWGTTHALLSAENNINEPLCIINADDYYGADSMQKMFDFLKTVDRKSTRLNSSHRT